MYLYLLENYWVSRMLEVYPSESYFINAYLKLSVDESDKTEFEEVPAT